MLHGLAVSLVEDGYYYFKNAKMIVILDKMRSSKAPQARCSEVNNINSMVGNPSQDQGYLEATFFVRQTCAPKHPLFSGPDLSLGSAP